MTDPDSKKSAAKWLGIAILVLLFIVVLAWFRNPLGDVEQPPEVQPTPDATEWTAEPDEAGVPVALPTTDMTPAGEEPATGEGAAGTQGE